MVAGAPVLNVGEEYVVFLWTSRSGVTQVIGLTQGLFRVGQDAQGNTIAMRPAATETMLDKNGRLVSDQPLTLRVNDLRSRVSQAGVSR